MKNRFNKYAPWTVLICLIALAVWAANPSFSDFSTTQFGGTTKVFIKSGALLTNSVFQDVTAGPSLLVSDQVGLSSVQKIFEVDDSMSTPKFYVTGDGHVHSDGSFSALTPSFSGAMTLNSVSYTANTLLKLDGSKVAVSLANGTGALTNDGSGTFGYFTPGTVTSVAMTVPTGFAIGGSPVTSSGTLAVTLSTETANTVFAGPTSGSAATPTFRAMVQADIPTIVTNTGDSVTMVPFQWGFVTTNNNIVLNNLVLAGAALSSGGVTWSVEQFTNSSAAAKTVLVPATVAMSGTALGSTTTCYYTNVGILTVWTILGNNMSNGTWRTYP